MVKRVYVEKRNEFNPEASSLLNECTTFLNIPSVKEIKIINRYDVEGISDEAFEEAKHKVFSEAQVDILHDTLPDYGADAIIAIEALPGQFDQRADSAAQCIELLTEKERPVIKYAKIILLFGELSEKDVTTIKEHCINPVESREASLEEYETLKEQIAEPNDIVILDGFIEKDEAGLEEVLKEYGLAMGLDDLLVLQDYYKGLKRNPSMTELKVIDTYWSDHCRHTTFSTHLDHIEIEDEAVKEAYERYEALRKEVYGEKERNITLMDVATIGAKALKKRGLLPELDESEEINACSIHIKPEINGETKDWLLMFKNETHNHPTEIEPFGGAATCIGGCIRDPLSGRVYVHQAMRFTGGGDPREKREDTLEGKLPQRKLALTAASGYSSYGNQIGLATGLVSEMYHEGYKAKRLECGAVVGAAPKENVVRERPEAGDVIVLLGGRTGRDGIGGATGSSKTHNLDSLETMASEVQKGNAPEERKIQRLFRKKEVAQMIKRCNDFGAGGVSVAIGELADGLCINLDAVRKKYDGLDGTEIAISESQERMAVVLKKEDVSRFIAEANKENLEAYQVAEVTDDDTLVMTWRDKEIVHIDRSFLSKNGAVKHSDVFVAKKDRDSLTKLPYDNLKDMASSLRCASRKGLVDRFDATIGGYNVLFPYGGKYKRTHENKMVSLLPTLPNENTKDASIMAWGFDADMMSQDPYYGAYAAVYNSIAKLVAGGAAPSSIYLSFQEFFERLGNQKERWGKPFSALLGALDAQMETSCAAIGGKDSMSGSFMDLDVPPTLISFAISPIKTDDVISSEFKQANHKVILLKADTLKEHNACFEAFHQLVKEKKIYASHTVENGIAAALMNMSFGNRIGFEASKEIEAYVSLPAAIIAEVDKEVELGETLGYTTEKQTLHFDQEEVEICQLEALNDAVLEEVYPIKHDAKKEVETISSNLTQTAFYTGTSLSQPVALIPVFPGTNCEFDLCNALEEAGGKGNIFVIRNQTSEDVKESVREFVEEMKKAQMVLIPGGFSAGDEPDGSAKFITAFFRNPVIKEELERLLNEREGLMLGICNGFQALIKLGLVPYGKIIEPNAKAPTLSYNTIGRHQSQIVRTRISSTMSPWLSGMQVGDIVEVPISHGEGRFIVEDDLFEELVKNGQIATQYVDYEGLASSETVFNPNGSMYAVEGITSKDGRIFGKMGHTERIRKGAYKNIYGKFDYQLFTSAMKYFKG